MIFDYVIEAPKECFVQNVWVISGCNDDAVGVVLFNHQQKTIQDPPDFTHVICHAALAADRIKFIKKINTSSHRKSIENLAQLCRSLAHEFGDQRIQSNNKQRNAEFAGQGRGGHCLARPGRADQKEFSSWVQPVAAQLGKMALLFKHALQDIEKRLC